MRSIRSFILLLGVFCASLSAEAQISSTNPLQTPPTVQAWSVDGDLQLDATGSGTWRIAVQVPPEHHGYLDKGDEGLLIPLAFTFTPFEERRARVSLLSRPQGTRDEKAHATVLRGRGDFTFRVETAKTLLPMDTILPATLRYQICNDVTNICYPPRTIDVPLRIASAATASGSPAALSSLERSQAESLTMNERISALFQRHMGNLLLAFALVFAAGLVATATPCVYPILPMTSAFLMARGGESRQRGRLHAVVYFFGMILFYVLLGVLAATTGTALSALMTNAWMNLGFAVVFAYLGLSLLGLYEFQFLPSLTANLDAASSRWGGFTGTFFMGSTAGLVISPCVGPVVGAILLQITGQAAAVSATSTSVPASIIVRGIVLMTGFGAGLGLPFLVVGLLSKRLPQSGPWLTKVKFLLGLPVLYFAYTYYLKSMETHGVPTNVSNAMLVGSIAIGVAALLGAFHSLGEHPPRGMLLRRGCGIIVLVVGVHFLYNGLGRAGILIEAPTNNQSIGMVGSNSTVQATSNNPNTPQLEIHGNLRWLRDFPRAQQQARFEQKPLFVDFYATWCANCKAFERLTMRDSELNEALQQTVLAKIYDTDTVFGTFQQDHRFLELKGVGGQPFLPLFAIYSPQGTLVWKGQDYQAVHTMIAQLDRARYISPP